MTNTESAVYNRISTKCHLYVKTYFPAEYKNLVAAAQKEYESRKYRRTSLSDLQNALKPPSEADM